MANEEHENGAKLPAWKIWLIRLILLGILIGVVIIWPRGVAAFVGGLAIFILILYYWIRYKVKKWWGDSGIGDQLFPTEVNILRVDGHKWQKIEEVEAKTNAFRRAEFVELGDYTIEEMSSIKIRAFMLESECIYGTIYEDSLPRILVDITTTYQNGDILNCTTTPETGLEHPPNKQMIRMPETTEIAKLLYTFRENCLNEPRMPVSVDEFPERICRSVKEENEWRMKHYEELERRGDALIENYLSKSTLSGVEWEKTRERTVFIHGKLSKNEIVDQYTRLLDCENREQHNLEESKAKKCFDDGDRLETFSCLIEGLSDERKPQKVAELEEPVRADVYLYPELPEDEDDDY